MERDYLFDLSPIPMWIVASADHSFLAANREAQGLYGLSLNQLMGMGLKDVLADPYPEIKDHKTGIGEGIVQRHRNREGGTFYLRLNTAPITYAGRAAILVVAVEVEQDPRPLIDQNTDLGAHSLLDGTGKFMFADLGHCRMFGCAPGELLGRKLLDFVHPEERGLFSGLLESLIQGGSFPSGTYAFIRGDGERRWMSCDLSVVSTYGKGKAVKVVLWDVTEKSERQLHEQALERIERGIIEATSLETLVDKAIQAVLGLQEVRTAEIWIVCSDPSSLGLRGRASKRDGQYLLEGFSPSFSCRKGEGIPGRVWMEMGPVTARHAPPGNQTAFGVPILAEGKFLGCLICYSTGPLERVEATGPFLERAAARIAEPIAHKLKESEYRMLFDISPDPHCIIGRDGQIEMYNSAFSALVTTDGAISTGSTVLQFVHPEDIMRAKRDFISMVNGWSTGPYRCRVATAEGHLRTLLWSAAISRESMRIIAVGKDVTDQVRAEQELHGALKKLQNAQKIAKLGYWFRPVDSQISNWSEETFSIYERAPGTFVPSMENLRNTFFPDDRHLLEKDPALLLEPNAAKGFEHRIFTPEGRIKWVRQEVRMVTSEDGTPQKLEGTIQDITERKSYEERLSMSNEIFRLAMLASNEMIWHVDMQGKTHARGGGGHRPIEQESPEEFSIDNSWFTAISPSDRERVWDSLWKVIADKEQSAWCAEYRTVAADGSVHHYQDRCHVLRDPEGNAVQLVGAALDVTISRRHVEMIEEQNRILRDISWSQSHLLRAPLTRLMGLADISMHHAAGGLQAVRIMELIRESAEELDMIIRTMTEKANSIENGTKDDTLDR